MGTVRITVDKEVMKRLGCDLVVNVSLAEDKGLRLEMEKERACSSCAGAGDMLAYMEAQAGEKDRRGRLRTAETYRATLTRWRDFLSTRCGGTV